MSRCADCGRYVEQQAAPVEPPTLALPPAWADVNDLARKWWKFHASHPEVGRELANLALRLVRNGHRHLGIGMLWETLRYTTLVGRKPTERGPRLNDHYRAYYARWLMETDRRLAGVFATRATRGDA